MERNYYRQAMGMHTRMLSKVYGIRARRAQKDIGPSSVACGTDVPVRHGCPTSLPSLPRQPVLAKRMASGAVMSQRVKGALPYERRGVVNHLHVWFVG